VEPINRNEIGSIANTHDRLLLWASRSLGSLIKAEFASEFSRQRVIAELRASLADRGIPFYELVLPAQQEPVEVVRAILLQIADLPTGVFSVTGFANSFSSRVPLAEAMGVLNFNRDKLIANSLCQIWWMTPVFSQLSLFAMPDITSWFTTQLNLTEVLPSDDVGERSIAINNAGGVYGTVDDARRRAQGLLQRLRVAQEAGVDDNELLEAFLLPALEALADVGAQKDLHDLSLQFEGMLGQLKIPLSSQLIDALNRIANLYKQQGKYTEAEPFYLRALVVSEEQLGTNHLNTAAIFNNIAELYRFMGRYTEAEPLYRRSLAIYEEQLGADHPFTSTSLNNLAGLYESTGRYSEAEPLYLRSLAIREEQLGANHPDTATSLNNLASLYRDMGQYSEAEPLYVRSLQIAENTLGTNHPTTQTIRKNLEYLKKEMS
jgi:tetratricopeptide (TPR) repeat protein